jgi:hypothetical protein
MYIYLLHSARSRLPRQGEELVVQRLDTGRLAFVSMSELERLRKKTLSIWADFLDCLPFRRAPGISTVNIPAGAHLLLRSVPPTLQESLGIAESEEVVITRVFGRDYSYRDALILPDETKVLVQDLCENIEATVLCLPSDISARQEELHLAS